MGKAAAQAAAKREHVAAAKSLEAARESNDPVAVQMAESAMRTATARVDKASRRGSSRTKLHDVATYDAPSAWSVLLMSLPKRTKIKVLTKNAFRKVVHELHQEKLTSTGADKVPEPVFIQEFFQKRYGLEEIADTYLFGFLCSMQKYTPQEMGFA